MYVWTLGVLRMTAEEAIPVIEEAKRVLEAAGWFLDCDKDYPEGDKTHLRMSKMVPFGRSSLEKKTWEIFYHGSEECIDAYSYNPDDFECFDGSIESGKEWAKWLPKGGKTYCETGEDW